MYVDRVELIYKDHYSIYLKKVWVIVKNVMQGNPRKFIPTWGDEDIDYLWGKGILTFNNL